MPDVIIVGGGASGLMAAVSAAGTGRQVLLLERQARVGRKLLATGNGRCNLTNTGTAAAHYHGARPAFCKRVFGRFGVEQTLEFFRSLGLMTVTEYGGRVYPMSQQANSVLDVLRLGAERRGVQIMTGAPVEGAERTHGGFTVRTADALYRAPNLIIACGGCAGAKLGGVSDGYRLLAAFGHTRTALYPALTGLRTDSEYPRALKGIRTDAEVALCVRGSIYARSRGDLLFAENGVSGTVIFDLSRAAAAAGEGAELVIDFFPELSGSQLTEYLCAKRLALPDVPANTVLTGSVHNRLGMMLCKAAGIGADTAAGTLTDAQLQRLSALCRAFTLHVTGIGGFESAQVTAGGIRTDEFMPETLRSRTVPGLYACGEVLDVDGDCGGYNLQWAWSSGWVAGRLGT